MKKFPRDIIKVQILFADGVPVLEKDEDLERFVPSSASIDCSKEIIQRIKKHYFPNGFDINSYIQVMLMLPIDEWAR